MRFLVTPSRDALERARPPVRVFLVFSALLLAAVVAQRAAQGELAPAGVVERYLGTGGADEVMPWIALVETLHGTAFVYGFLLLMLGSLLVVSPVPSRVASVLTVGSAAACLLDLATPFLVVALSGWGALRTVSLAAVLLFLGATLVVLGLAFGRDRDDG